MHKTGIIIFAFIVLAGQFLVGGYKASAHELSSSENVSDTAAVDDVRGVLNDWEYTETGDAVILKRYIGTSADIIIPGVIDGKQVFLQNSGVGTGLDRFPANTTSIIVGNADQKVKVTDGNAARLFSGLTNLVYLDAKGLNTSDITTMDYMFQNCNSLAELDISGWNTGNVTSMYSMFRECRSLTELDLSSWDIGLVTDISCMFYSCTGLTGLDISGWNTGNITGRNMDAIFYNCSSLITLDVSGWNTSGVSTMQNIFFNCSSLRRLDLSSWDTSNVVSMNYMFYYCRSLEELNISGWNTGKVQGILYMFYNCSKLQILDLSGHDYSSVIPGLNVDVFDLEDASAMLPTLIISNDSTIKSICDEPVAGRVPAGPTYHFGAGKFIDENGNSKSVMQYFDTLLVTDINHFTVYSIANKYIPHKEGGVFSGWYLDEAFSQPFETAGAKMNLIELLRANLYAKYLDQYTVTFVDYDGSILKETIVPEGGAATAPEENPVRPGYIFTGWDKGFENVTEDMVIKALYEEKKGTQENVDDNEDMANEEISVPEMTGRPAEIGTVEEIQTGKSDSATATVSAATPETADTAAVGLCIFVLFSSFIAIIVLKVKNRNNRNNR